jgi:ABC-type polysaccharide transport system permease subunit
MGVSTVERKQAQEGVAPKRRRRRTEWLPYWLVVPSLLLILVINLYPFATGFLYSLRDGTMLKEGDFVGLANYTALLTDSNFHHSLVFSVVFALGGVFGSYSSTRTSRSVASCAWRCWCRGSSRRSSRSSPGAG